MCGVCLSCNIRAELKQLNTYLLAILSYTAAHNRRMLCHYHSVYISLHQNSFFFFFLFFLAILCGHSGFSSPPQRPMTSDFERFSIPDFIHYIYFPILILEKEPAFSLLNVQCLTRALLVPFLERLWYDAVLDWGLNPGPPALEASME